MKRVGITQRVEVVAGYGERRDCLDQAWTVLFGQLGWDLVPVPNGHCDIVAWAQRQGLQGLVLSGGNDLAHLPCAQRTAPERDATEYALLNWASASRLPVLGVCRGMQILNVWLGGKLEPVTGHVACRHPVWPCDNIPQQYVALYGYTDVNSFHDWGVTQASLAMNLVPHLWAADGSIEAFVHDSLPWVGIMWHPERDNENSTVLDLALLKSVFNT
ncbi:gamma-glutamyl-gamma-aminobutyrate hydrolase family protein [Vibrio cholerae]|uniref:gamma-glutamyl-gamma-aminobutyrate hydrolase family protein n=1 Tax=Vibrio cholerae TaxID=666 RepID=UPI0022701622|nr:gamma-glutamyl-gamma-aminobutyrate hydrolase family protein [Vibrio cholerae]MCX9450334.1 gamma-glutamyl-gamma-aminobutyrate hydrolase family protein [Vibrio cholerae]